jgi:hypothetical protein
VQSVL